MMIFVPMKELLFRLCRYPFDPDSAETLKESLEEVKDWDETITLINQHGIVALAAYNIRSAGLESLVPQPVLAKFEAGYRQSVVRNIWLTERWKSVNKILSEAGIKHILLKGMALEYTVYGGQGLRQMTDNDIFISSEDALKAWDLLRNHGFIPEILKSRLHRKIITDIGKHLPSLHKNGYSIEIHHRLFYGKDADRLNSDIVETAREIVVSGTVAYVPRDDIHISYLQDHLKYHLLNGVFQMRLYADMELLKPDSAPPVDNTFYLLPKRKPDFNEKRKLYRMFLSHLPGNNRLRYIIGDIFPSVRWLKRRHNCGTFEAFFYYPRRIAKLFWLVGRNRNIPK
jgi:hypothetical protein